MKTLKETTTAAPCVAGTAAERAAIVAVFILAVLMAAAPSDEAAVPG